MAGRLRTRFGRIELAALAAVAVVATGLIAAVPAMATFPGANGVIAYSVDEPRCCAANIHLIQPDGTGDVEVTRSPGPSFEDPAFSADGQTLVFSSSDFVEGRFRVARTSLDGTGFAELTLGQQPSLSPDGSSVVYTRGSLSRRFGFSQVNLFDLDGENRTELTNHWAWHDPVFSPDGTQIAVGKRGDVVVMNTDGSGVTNLTKRHRGSAGVTFGSFGEPDYAPDGTRLAVSGSRDGSRSSIYLIRPDGTGLQPLVRTVRGGQLAYPIFSPDGTELAYVDRNQNPYRIRVVNLASGAIRTVASTPVEDGRGPGSGLAWQPLPPVGP